MKRIFLSAILVLISLTLIGCGHHDSSPQIFSSFIISNPNFDGDIADSPTGFFITTIAGGAQSVLAGIDFSSNTEYRAFLDFPLGGSGGVPLDAVIDSASLDIKIDGVSIQSGNTIPIRIDLVDIPSQTLAVSDYDRIQQQPLASMTISIFQTDVGNHVIVDVTSLMTKAQRLGLANFQIRILEDLGLVIPGFIEIDDSTATAAPQLQVNYF